MRMDAVIQTVTKKFEALLQADSAHFLVAVSVKPTNNIKVFVDGDKGVGIDDLVRYNRALYKQLEEEELFPNGDFSLEVSSAGLGEPLKLHRQYVKNINRFVEATLLDGAKIEGRLLQVNDDAIVIEETKGKGKKAEAIEHNIPLANIKTTYIQIKF